MEDPIRANVSRSRDVNMLGELSHAHYVLLTAKPGMGHRFR